MLRASLLIDEVCVMYIVFMNKREIVGYKKRFSNKNQTILN